jgi:hypothetical protein
MAHFAKKAATHEPTKFIVTDVIVADQSFIDTGLVGDPALWVKTSYNTYGNVHYAPSPPAAPMTPDGEPAFRANYAGVGFTYDTSVTIDGVEGVFYAPQPFSDWVLNTSTYLWVPPIPYPDDGKVYNWSQELHEWVLAPNQVTI